MQDKIKSLDGFRGLAVLLVFIFHAAAIVRPENPSSPIYTIVSKFGWVGVDLFFILSGFLITGILLNARKSGYFITFWRNRAVRILPAYYLFILIALPLSNLAYLAQESAISIPPLYYIFFVSNVPSFLEGAHPQRHLSVLWSIAVEQHFYLIWPFFIRWIKVQYLAVLLICCLGVLPLARAFLFQNGFADIGIYVFTLTHCDALLVGSLIAVLTKMAYKFQLRKILLGAFVATVLLTVFINSFPRDIAFQSLKYSLVPVLGAALFMIAWRVKYAGIIFLNPALIALGKISYSFYLWHVTILISVSFLFAKFGILSNSVTFQNLALIGLSFICTYILSSALWHLFEKHMLLLKTPKSLSREQAR